ncbi:MAG: hypothetical protein CM15mP83_6690 [Flavobacteriaceae bacterium]|nr:MAG: hypothetical protein CM15mP83_6690 [Flavobacteriaceae bacterium]
MNRIISSLIFLLVSSFSFAQDAGIDDRINEAFTPIANWWGALSYIISLAHLFLRLFSCLLVELYFSRFILGSSTSIVFL